MLQVRAWLVGVPWGGGNGDGSGDGGGGGDEGGGGGLGGEGGGGGGGDGGGNGGGEGGGAMPSQIAGWDWASRSPQVRTSHLPVPVITRTQS